MKTVQKHSKILKTQERDYGQRELNKMLVKKSSWNEINKEGTFAEGFKDWRKIKRKKLMFLRFYTHFSNLLISSNDISHVLNSINQEIFFDQSQFC